MLKGATIHFYCLFDELHFQTSVIIMECIEFNWLCKHIKKIKSSQPAIPVLNWVKHHPFPVSIVKEILQHSFFSCEYCEKTYVEEYLQMTASIFQKCFMLIESVAAVSVLSHMLIREATNLFFWLFHDGGPYHIETSPLIFTTN